MQLKHKEIFRNKKILITGHTGFKGSWLCSWMVKLGGKVTGISNGVPSSPSHFDYLNLKKKIKSHTTDIRDYRKLNKIIKKTKPDFIFHLAAQALVKKSYEDPSFTFETNIVGTKNLLESLRDLNRRCIVIIITSDKVYKNLESKNGYREEAVLGGIDPYSASKASAEITINSYIQSYFKKPDNKILISIARAGNVIGGGDWAKNRLVPDCVKAWSKNKKVILRNPSSTRPWQHVLEAIWAYILLAQNLKLKKKLHGEAFNFGPSAKNNHSVKKVVKLMKKNWKNVSWSTKKNLKNIHETNILKLNSSKAYQKLNWKCLLTIEETMQMVSEWYKIFYLKRQRNFNITNKQIEFYEKILTKKG